MEYHVLLLLNGALVSNHSITFLLARVDFAGGYLHVPDIVYVFHKINPLTKAQCIDCYTDNSKSIKL